MPPTALLLLTAFAVCVLLLIATVQHATKLRTDMRGWRQIALQLAAELHDLRRGH